MSEAGHPSAPHAVTARVNALIFLVGVTIFLLALFAVPSRPLPPTMDRGGRVQSPSSESTMPLFVDRTLSAGLLFEHHQGEENLSGIDESLAPGACAFDYDNDGWTDLSLVNGSGQTRYYGKAYWWQRANGNALFRNRGGLHFENVTEAAGLGDILWGMGCVTADLDGDGDAELWVTTRNGSRLYRNDQGHFTDVTAAAGIAGTEWATTAVVDDYDRDGFPDVYVANYVDFVKGTHAYEAAAQFLPDVPPDFTGNLFQPQPNRLFRNRGRLRFEEVAMNAGVADTAGRSLGAAWLSANEDDRPDLLVANDRGIGGDGLWLNHGAKGFEPAELSYNTRSSAGHRGIAVGDLDGDGRIDLVLGSARDQLPTVLIRQSTGSNTSFIDRSREIGVGRDEYSGLAGWTPGLLDADNDGDIDLFMANGLVTPDPDSPRVAEGQPKRLWLNLGAEGFLEVSDKAGLALQDTQSARGAALADFDNDGDMDIYVAHNNDLGQLLINETPTTGHWLEIKLIDASPNRDAIGAQVRINLNGSQQSRIITAGSGFASDSDRRLHFGLAQAGRVDELTITWLDGSRDTYRDIAADRCLIIRQHESRWDTGPSAIPAASGAPPSFPLPTSEDEQDYLRLVSTVMPAAGALQMFRTFLRSPQPQTRRFLASRLGREPIPGAQALLVDMLDDTDAGVAAEALRSLCGYEDEATVRWLLRVFRDPRPDLRSAVAECFGFYFREEEAVVHRKYLALPHLIRQAEGSESAPAIAAIRALGDSERYRGLEPLGELLLHASSEIQAEAASALGLIRERAAISPLLQTFNAPATSPPVRAQILVALKRLGYPETARMLSDFIGGNGQFATVAPSERLAVAVALLSDPLDGLVFAPKEVTTPAIEWAQTALVDTLEPSAGLSLVTLAARAEDRRAGAILEAMTHHPQPDVRAAALVTLSKRLDQGRAKWVNTALRDPALPVRTAMLEELSRGRPLERDCGALLETALMEPSTRLAALHALHSCRALGSTLDRFLEGLAHDPTGVPEIRAAAIDALATRGIALPGLRMGSLPAGDTLVKRSLLNHWGSLNRDFIATGTVPDLLADALSDDNRSVQGQMAELLVRRKEPWAKALVEATLADVTAKPELRQALLARIEPSRNAYERMLTVNIARNQQDPLRRAALRQLAGTVDPEADRYARQCLHDRSEDPGMRLAAAALLANREPTEVMAILTAGAPGERP